MRKHLIDNRSAGQLNVTITRHFPIDFGGISSGLFRLALALAAAGRLISLFGV